MCMHDMHNMHNWTYISMMRVVFALVKTKRSEPLRNQVAFVSLNTLETRIKWCLIPENHMIMTCII